MKSDTRELLSVLTAPITMTVMLAIILLALAIPLFVQRAGAAERIERTVEMIEREANKRAAKRFESGNVDTILDRDLNGMTHAQLLNHVKDLTGIVEMLVARTQESSETPGRGRP